MIRQKHSGFYLIVCLSVQFCVADKSYAEHSGRTLLRLDGNNSVIFDQEYPHRSRNSLSIVYGNPLDSFPFQYISAYGFSGIYDSSIINAPILAASGRLSAEPGDPLLNRIIQDPGYNRDHSTIFSSACRLPYVPVFVYSGYRYIDIYTDRFDKIWDDFYRRTGEPMKFKREGILKESAGGYAFSSDEIMGQGNIVKYGSWGATPYFFSPVYKTGYRTKHELNIGRDRSRIFTRVSFDHHEDYYDHRNAEKFNDLNVSSGTAHYLSNEVMANITITVNTATDPSSRIEASIHDSISPRLTWKYSGGLYDNYHPFAGLSASFKPLRTITLRSDAGWEYIPQERPFTFTEYERTVSYNTIAHETVTFHTSAEFSDTILFPLRIKAFYDYYERPLWEKIGFMNDTILITQDTFSSGTPWHAGGKGSYLVSLRNYTFELWGNMSLTQKNRLQRFISPMSIGIDVRYGRLENDSLYALIRSEYRAPTILRYRNDPTESMEIFTSPARFAVSGSLRFPFLSPIARDHLTTCLWVEAGPVNITSAFLNKPKLANLRLKDHPCGNLTGPSVAVRFEGTIR